MQHKKDCALTSVFYRLASRHGAKKAIVGVAHRIVIIAFHLIRDGGLYREQGDTLSAARVAVCLGWDYAAFRGEGAVSRGWLATCG